MMKVAARMLSAPFGSLDVEPLDLFCSQRTCTEAELRAVEAPSSW